MIENLGMPDESRVSQILYYRNRQETVESPTADYAQLVVKYSINLQLMKRNIIPYSSKTHPLDSKMGVFYFFEKSTRVDCVRFIHDFKKSGVDILTEVVLNEAVDYDGFMTSDVVRNLIKQKNLMTFLKLGDINEWEDSISIF